MYGGRVESRPVALSAPPAGAGFDYVVPGSERQVVESVSFTLETAIAVANRVPFLQIVGADGVPVAEVGAPFTLTALKTCRVTFAVGVQQFGANDAARIGCGIPPLWLAVGMRVVVGVYAVQAADQISDVAVYVAQAHNGEG